MGNIVIESLFKKVSKGPLKVGIDRLSSSPPERSYQRNMLGRQNHGVVVTNIFDCKVSFFAVTRHEVSDREPGNQILNVNNQAAVAYVADLIEFFKLVEEYGYPNSQIQFEDMKEWTDFISKLDNRILKPIELNYDLHCELDFFIKTKLKLLKFDDKDEIEGSVKDFLNTKGYINISVKYNVDFNTKSKSADRILVYHDMDLENFLDPEVLKCMEGCTSDILDIATRFCETCDLATKDKIYPILERLGLLLLENPESNPRFYFDSSYNENSKISVKEEYVKVNKVKEFDESVFVELKNIDKEIDVNKDFKLLGNIQESE
jgi:hypothetical protein